MIDRSMIWHVVFHPGQALWSRRFRHVSLAGFTNDTWVHLDLALDGVAVAPLYAYDDVQDYLSTLLTHYTVVHFGPALSDRRHFLRPMTCVSFAKHVLGVRSGALRPDALFRDLVRDYGAKVLNETENPERNPGAEAATPAG